MSKVELGSVLIVAVLDRSGSMGHLKADVIGGFNTFLKDQQEQEGEAQFTLVQFDSEIEFLKEMVDIKDMEPLNETTFVPRGSTSLNDAIGMAIERTGTAIDGLGVEGPDGVVFLIVTDGEENTSQEFTTKQIRDLIKVKEEEKNWSFIYLAANVDAFAEGGSRGVRMGATKGFEGSSEGVRVAYASMGETISSYREDVTMVKGLGLSEKDEMEELKKTKAEIVAEEAPADEVS